MRVYRLTFLIALITLTLPLSAQSGQGNKVFTYSLIVVGALIVVGLLISLADNLMQIEAKKNNLDTSKGQFSIFPTLSQLFSSKIPEGVKAEEYHKFKKGFDLKLAGKPKMILKDGNVKTFAVQPSNFRGISPIPKVTVEVGDEVEAGDQLFFDKKRPNVKYVAPVSGEVIAVNRGDKRSIASVVILADKKQKYKSFDIPALDKTEREDLIGFLKETGSFVYFNQRPFDTIPDDNVVPKNIFITTFDTAPLAPDNNFIINGQKENFQKGIDVLNNLTDGKVYLGLDGKNIDDINPIFKDATGVEKNYFNGKHPAGNVGIQIHHIDPVSVSDKVWTITVQEVVSLGSLFLTGNYHSERIIALAGPQLSENVYIKTNLGANIGELLEDRVIGDNNRIIAGDPLSGRRTDEEEFLNFHDDQVTVIEEGDEYELFGWLLPVTPRPSISKTFPNFLFPKHEFIPDTNTHGEKRAFVMTGQYESVLPMNIYPQHLMKAILTGDIEKMEGLGLAELTEEDIALCEFVCTSKQPLQFILRDGLNQMQEQV